MMSGRISRMLQSVISRMDGNTRACKTWALTLVAAILVVVTKFEDGAGSDSFGPLETWIAVVPTTLFWMLDSYYLALERAFRKSYEEFVRRLHDKELRRDELFQIHTPGKQWEYGLPSLFSISTFPFYAVSRGGRPSCVARGLGRVDVQTMTMVSGRALRLFWRIARDGHKIIDSFRESPQHRWL